MKYVLLLYLSLSNTPDLLNVKEVYVNFLNRNLPYIMLCVPRRHRRHHSATALSGSMLLSSSAAALPPLSGEARHC